MTRDPGLITLTAVTAGVFAAIAIFFGTFIRSFARKRRLKLPPRSLEIVFRLFFAILALGALYLAFHGR